MENRLSNKGLKFVSNLVISFFAAVSLAAFLVSIDRTAVVILISLILLGASIYLMWFQDEFDSISLLVFFFGTTACFYFFSDSMLSSWPKGIAIAAFAVLSLILSNYLLNTVRPVLSPQKALYKIALAIVFTEIFWVLSFLQASQIAKGAITALIFFNFEYIIRDVLSQKFERKKFAFLFFTSIILLIVVVYRMNLNI